jgi:putative DNA methylase
MTAKIVPFSLKNAPSLIEYVLPAQKLSAESYKEQMAVHGKTLTALGSYWKGRKPLILNRACVLGALLPVTQPVTAESLQRDLAVFESLMAMDDAAVAKRRGEESTTDLPALPYGELIAKAARPEQCGPELYDHMWDRINVHLGTNARTFEELVEQIGAMRFGHRPRVADTFCGSGQIPFEAARLGCDVYASDLSPVACMLTWGAFNVVGGSKNLNDDRTRHQSELLRIVQAEIDELRVETDDSGWRGKHYLYCLEATCPESGWAVPLLPSLVVSQGRKSIAELVPDPKEMRYEIRVHSGVSASRMTAASIGTVRSDGRGQEPYLTHSVGGRVYRSKISSIRGDYVRPDGTTGNLLRQWDKSDLVPRQSDIFRERLYAIQWTRPKASGKSEEFEFRTVTDKDQLREEAVTAFVAKNLSDWQANGWLPDMRIERGEKTDEPIRTRGWTHWHHLFNPRQLLIAGLIRKHGSAIDSFALGQIVNVNSRCSRWNPAPGPGRAGLVCPVFDNQALNTLLNYGCRATAAITSFLPADYKSFPLPEGLSRKVDCVSAESLSTENDIYISDPPYGDAVKYEEILEFFIAWIRKNPPPEFANWVWDSRRALAIKGEDEDFRRGMVASYKRMTDLMPDNGLQIIMFTHQSGSIWADMANIVWAAGLHVTAAWYVVTEIDSALREGAFVKGTVLLVLRKRLGALKTGRDDLAWEIQEEVQGQVDTLIGLNQSLVGSSRAPNQFSDADLQMAGYAAALRVLTRYSIIDGKQMAEEALRPRQRGEPTMVDELIEFAVGVANNCLVPSGLTKPVWDRLRPAERFYLKLLELEARCVKTLDNYQNFAKAFKVADFRVLMASQKANSARLKSAEEFGRAEMSGESELANCPLRGVLYALMELQKDTDGDEVLQHLSFNVEDYFSKRPILVELCGFLARQLTGLREEEASAARVLHDLIKNQRL